MDTQDKRTNNVLIQSIFYLGVFIMDTQDKQTNNIFIQRILPVFLKWTHRTNGQTIFSLKGFYPCLFRMDTQDKWSNNILI